MARHASPEHNEQVLFFKRVALDPRTSEILITAIPNGGFRFKATAAKLKAEGVKAGVPDILCFERSGDGIRCGLAIEMKRPKTAISRAGTVSDSQQGWLDGLRDCSWEVAVCYSAEEAWDKLMGHLGM